MLACCYFRIVSRNCQTLCFVPPRIADASPLAPGSALTRPVPSLLLTAPLHAPLFPAPSCRSAPRGCASPPVPASAHHSTAFGRQHRIAITAMLHQRCGTAAVRLPRRGARLLLRRLPVRRVACALVRSCAERCTGDALRLRDVCTRGRARVDERANTHPASAFALLTVAAPHTQHALQMTPCGMTQRQRQTTTTGRMLSLSLLAIGLLVALLCCSSGVQAQRRSSLPVHSFNVVTVPVLSFNIAEANGTAGVGLAGRSIDFVPAFAGISLPISSDPDSLLRMNIMLPHKDDDPTGCSGPWRSMNEFNQSFAGSFVLQRQSTCLNTVNYLYAAMSGARGVIAYGCPTTEPFNCAAGLLEILVYTRIHTATVLSITNEDGEAILAYLNEAKAAAAPDAPALNSMVLEFVSTGPIVPEERAALVSMMKTTTMFPFAGGQVPAAQDLWSVARFNSSTLDPCRDRVKGLWCERSHVVWVSPWYHAWLGPVPAEFGELTHLRAINLFASRLRGAIPESWCNLHDLRSLAVGDSLAQPFITSFPACMGSSMPLLEELYFSGHGIKHLPASFSLLTNLRYLEGPRNEIAGPLFDLTQMPNLTLVSLSLNRFNGSLPALHPAAPLSQFGMSGNLLTGTIDPGYFANKPLLRIIDVNSNALSGSLPPLTGCPNLEIVDFSTNAFSGPVPGGLAPAPWSALQRLKTLNLQENSLVSPVFLANLQALTRINLSNNRFNSSTLALPNNENFGVWMDSIFSPNLVSLRCSYNDLRGPWGVNAFVTSKTIQEIFVDHNGITSIPNEFFVVQALQMDVSVEQHAHICCKVIRAACRGL